MAVLWDAQLFRFTRTVARDILINVALYVPLGASAYFVYRRRLASPAASMLAIATGFTLSSVVEWLQRWEPGRVPNVIDIATNTAGTCTGIVLAGVSAGYIHFQSTRERKVDPAAASLLVVMGAWLLFPYFPIFGRTALYGKIAVLRSAPVIEPLRLASMAALWLLAGHLLKAVSFRWAVPVLAAATLLIPAQLLILGRQPVLSDFAGAAAGCLLFAFGTPPLASALFLITVVLVRGLMPGVEGSGIRRFSWLPFGGFLNQDWQPAVFTLIEKVVYYGGALWSLRQAGMNAVAATAGVAVALAALEAAQTAIPGRTPEITDPIVAILLGVMLLISHRDRAPTR